MELTQLVPAMDRQLGMGHDRTIKTRGLWAQTLAELGQFHQAVEVERQNLQYAQSRSSVDEDVVSLQKLTLAKLLKMSYLPRAGLPLAQEGLAFMDAKYPEPFWNREVARRLLGELLLEDGRVEAALTQFDLAAANSTRIDGYAQNIAYADILQVQAMALHVRAGGGDAERSLQLLDQALTIYSNALGVSNPATLRCATHLAWLRALEAVNDAGASAQFSTAAAAFAATMPREHVDRAELLLMRSQLSQRAGATADARQQLQSGKEAWRAAMGSEFKPPFIALH